MRMKYLRNFLHTVTTDEKFLNKDDNVPDDEMYNSNSSTDVESGEGIKYEDSSESSFLG